MSDPKVYSSKLCSVTTDAGKVLGEFLAKELQAPCWYILVTMDEKETQGVSNCPHGTQFKVLQGIIENWEGDRE